MDPPSVDCNSSKDPPSAGEEFVQKRRQQARDNRNENGSKPYSTIRFSNNLEVYTKTASNQYTSVTPTRSILRSQSKGKQVSSKPSGRRKDSLLEKIQRLSQEQNAGGPSEQEEQHGPVRPRRDWNIESLFTPSNEKKLESRNLAKRLRRVDPTGAIHTRTSNYEQYYSSEYLLKKYAVHSNGSPKANVDEFVPKLTVTVLPPPSPYSTNTSVSSTPTEIVDRQREPLSDSKLNDKLTTHKRFPATRIGRKKELSYLQLDENAAYDDPEFSINGGYNLANIIQRYPVDSPQSSIASYDQLLIQKSTSDTGCSDDEIPMEQKQFNWDGLYNDAPHSFDNSDFHHPDSKRSRTVLKPWAVWFLIGTVCVCIASTLLVYLTPMMNERGESSIYDNFKLDVNECTHHDHTSGRFVSDRYNTIRYHLLFQTGGNITMMDQPGSPQREALCWISEFDDYKIGITDGNEAAIVQRYSLAVIYFSTVKERETSRDDSVRIRKFNFLSALHECDWDGIMCNHSRDVTILRISNKSLSGKVPPEIGNLKSLNFVDLSLNQLTGEMPASISRLTSLDYLSLAFNEFKTPIPTVLGRMTNLNTLNLRSSSFLQQIPTNMGHLSKLDLLLLDGNSLSGTIPSELGSLSIAQQMNFRGNNLWGTVPKELCDLRNGGTLTELEVDETVDCDCCT